MYLTLKQKLTGACLAAVVVMASSLTWLAADQLSDQTQSGIYARVNSLSLTATAGISSWISIRSNIAHSFHDYDDQKDIVPFLQLARKAGGFDDIFLGTTTGNMLRSHPERQLAGYDPRTRPWYRDAVNAGKQIVTPASNDAITNELVITIAEPIFDNGSMVGVLGADVLIDKLITDVINLDVGENAHAMLLSNDGTFLAHQDRSLILEPYKKLTSELTVQRIRDALTNNTIEHVTVNGVEKLYYFADIPETDWALGIEMDKATEEANQEALLRELLVTSIVITLLMAAAVAWLVNCLFRDLNQVSEALEKIANGEGDLSQRFEPHSNDEIGQLAHNFNRFVGNMHGMVSRLRDMSDSLHHQADVTASLAEDRSIRILHQQDEINMVTTAINQLAAATQEIAANADNTAKTSTETVVVSKQSAKQVGKSQLSINGLAREVEKATGVIGELNIHAQNINTILSTIQGIAEQTNLLALNAAIEAARAGEQGRGFAVVADEVRTLAQRTHTSTQEIQQMIETLQQTTGNAVSIMEGSRSLAETSVDDASSASESLSKIDNSVTDISDMATQIASAAEEQAFVTAEITRNSESIRDVSQEFATEADEAAKQAAILSDLSNNLKQEINRFKL